MSQRSNIPGSNTSCGPEDCAHDEVDLTLCFEDTAILYSISAVFCLFAALEFLVSNKRGQRTPFGCVHLFRLVYT